ncbi:MAG: hypothetical protein COT89_01570 [Candidatus Colwellbacteria bacterium CG10_big_fil_rev_8_21_14_0_10_42_22]|uniref:Uncharacterized protein n=1 Tax=Candidatus Colwellbacteria bacterium CG10_big_fil_rev_8_21_14_0_10_42_22 TaxID=1974540 RepID=A0A2H0VFZ5_9BACT|nr:MAG: hypothetical protein COT89_01570 [Candidatus Colwellbacteria bacterium CG10_big_fil_rev_8_21_14_0_10_42_22]
MLGSAITALLFVGFMVFGVYVTNVSDTNSPDIEASPIREGLMADLDSLVESGEDTTAPTENRTAPESFFNRLRRDQSEGAKPSNTFSGQQAPSKPSTVLQNTYSNNQADYINSSNNPPYQAQTQEQSKTQNQYLPTIPSITEPTQPAFEIPSWWDDFLNGEDDFSFPDDDDI